VDLTAGAGLTTEACDRRQAAGIPAIRPTLENSVVLTWIRVSGPGSSNTVLGLRLSGCVEQF
jgi:hypothetical protein